MIIIGVTRKSGEFDGRHFDNYYLYYENPSVKTLWGIAPQFEKVSADVVNSFGGVDALQGVDIKLVYNKYGKVVEIQQA